MAEIWTKDLLSEAAFELLASSTVSRFRQKAVELAEKHGLAELAGEDRYRRQMGDELAELLRELDHKQLRDEAEFKTALLLAALFQAGRLSHPLLTWARQSRSSWIQGMAFGWELSEAQLPT
jgi:hypothetical protein